MRTVLICSLLALGWFSAARAQKPACVPGSNQQLIIYRAGSLTRAFKPIEDEFTCQTGIQIKDVAMGSVDAGRQITAGGSKSDLYAPADYLDIDLFMKPAGYADFDIVFARGRMVVAYSASALAAKKLAVPDGRGKWYDILTSPGVAIGGGNPFLDPGAYRAPMIFQLAEAFCKIPNLYNNLLEHMVVPGPDSGLTLGKGLDFQFTYEHSARAAAMTNPDYRYVDLPAEINLSDAAKDGWYRQNAVVAMPGLGTPRSARTIPVPAVHVAWGITIMKDAPNQANAVRFLEMLLGPVGANSLRQNGPEPLVPAEVSKGDLHKLPPALRHLVKIRAD